MNKIIALLILLFIASACTQVSVSESTQMKAKANITDKTEVSYEKPDKTIETVKEDLEVVDFGDVI